MISVSRRRTPKRLHTEKGAGRKVVLHEAYDEAYEARFVVGEIARLNEIGEFKLGDCGVMYRTNARSRALEERVVKEGMPYKLVGATRFYARREIRDIIAYLRLISQPPQLGEPGAGDQRAPKRNRSDDNCESGTMGRSNGGVALRCTHHSLRRCGARFRRCTATRAISRQS